VTDTAETIDAARDATAVPFRHVLTEPAELEALYRAPAKLVAAKKTDRIAEATAAFIGASPMLFMATADAEAHVTVSPKGGKPGFVHVLDEHHLAIPDVPGNNLIDGLRNLVANPRIGLLFILPGRDETLRVNGRAWPTTDPELIERFTVEGERRPKLVIGVEVERVFIHCSQSFEKGRVWHAETWGDLVAPSALELFRCHLADNLPPEELPGGGLSG
jgi:PPOX class probable FMN-dependent enzyme